jgi:hypothetical protein
MKFIFLILALIVIGISRAQLAPFTDFNNYFKTFYKNSFRQLEFQPVKFFEATDNLIVYIDFRGDFKLYDGEKVQVITNQEVQYKVSDNQLVCNIGPVLYHYTPKQEKKELLTTFGREYFVTDSLVVYEDTRYNSVNVRSNGKNTVLYQLTGDIYLPEKIGDNTIVLKENGDLIKFFWNNQFFEYAVYSRPIIFECGMNVICFNDPINQSFAVFDKGTILDLEPMFAKNYKAGRDYVVYEDQQGNLWHYKNGEKQQLSNFNVNSWDAVDDLVIWNENNMIYSFINNEKKMLLNFTPKDFKMKNATFVFKNNFGGISVFQNGKITELTKQLDCKYYIYGNTVLVELFNQSFVVFDKGVRYEN